MRLGDDFNWLRDHSANQEAPEVSLRGSWMLCTPSLLATVCITREYRFTAVQITLHTATISCFSKHCFQPDEERFKQGSYRNWKPILFVTCEITWLLSHECFLSIDLTLQFFIFERFLNLYLKTIIFNSFFVSVESAVVARMQSMNIVRRPQCVLNVRPSQSIVPNISWSAFKLEFREYHSFNFLVTENCIIYGIRPSIRFLDILVTLGCNNIILKCLNSYIFKIEGMECCPMMCILQRHIPGKHY